VQSALRFFVNRAPEVRVWKQTLQSMTSLPQLLYRHSWQKNVSKIIQCCYRLNKM